MSIGIINGRFEPGLANVSSITPRGIGGIDLSNFVSGAEHSSIARFKKWVQIITVWRLQPKRIHCLEGIFSDQKVHFKAIILTFPAENFERISYFAWSDLIFPIFPPPIFPSL